MAVRALALSGGAARGSFQLGAITALYEVYGFRPDLITGTSVGAINGVLLAQASPPAVNDPAAILAAVAAGVPDAGLARLRVLQAEWATFLDVSNLFSVQPAFVGTPIANAAAGLAGSGASAGAPISATIGGQIDQLSVLLAIPLVNLISGPLAADALQQLKRTVMAVLTENSVFNMDPIAARLNDTSKLDITVLPGGTPIYMATVALESGRLRYVDGKGNFTERDGRTPVISALMASDIDNALDENLQPVNAARATRIKDLVARYRAAVAAVAAGRALYRQPATTDRQRRAILVDVSRNLERGNYLVEILATQIQGLRLTTNVSANRGALASSSLPVLADPILIGAEHYIDGGLREIIPVDMAARAGVTDLVGICCSSLELPAVDEMTNAGLAAVGLRSLTEIAIAEITHDDLLATGTQGITTTFIAPMFDVHGGAEVDGTLIEISGDYGWMRTCDEMHPATPAERVEFRRLSELITRLRLFSYGLEVDVANNDWFVNAASTREPVATIRRLRWMIRELLAQRSALGLPLHPQAQRWWRNWVRGLQPNGPFMTISMWSKLSAFSSNGTEVVVADNEPDPEHYAADGGALVDAGSDRVYWVVRGAVFPAPAETEQTTAQSPVLVVARGSMAGLPRIPRGTHLLAEQDTPAEVWIVRNLKRYQATPALLTAGGLNGQPVALVPPGGLDQIPSGGAAFWLGGLVVSDSQGQPVEQWEPTPQVEGSATTTKVGLLNRTGQAIHVSSLTIYSGQDAPGAAVFTVTAAVPLTVAANHFVWVDVAFQPRRPGPINGSVAVVCDDVTLASFQVPLSTSATPLGSHGVLQVTPAFFDLGAIRAGLQSGQNVTLTNVGGRSLNIGDVRVVDESPVGQFAVPLSHTSQLGLGESTTVYVSCVPTVRGRLTARLTVDASGPTDSGHTFTQQSEVGLAATAQAPVAFLAGRPLPPARPPGRLPIPQPVPPLPRLEVELTTLDFGAAAPGATALKSFWIRNVGDLPLTVNGITSLPQWSFGVPDLSGFPAVVAPGGELQVEANFLAPNVAGRPAGGEMWIDSDDPLRPRAVLRLIGRAAGGHLSTQPSEFLRLDSGTPPTGDMVLTSDGTDPVELIKVGVSDHDFVISGFPPLPASLAPGSTLTIGVTYTGTTRGQHDTAMVLTHDADPGGSSQFNLRAEV